MIESCDQPRQPLLEIETALEKILATIQPVASSERLSISLAADRILAEHIYSPINVPPHRNSAMDGYALNSAEISDSSQPLPIAGYSFAGKPFTDSRPVGTAVRIMTGAVVPDDCDTVVMQENVKTQYDGILLEIKPAAGENIRLPGDDLKQDAEVLTPGRKLNAADLGLLASIGLPEVTVYRQPIISFFSTGDELKGLGQILGLGDIYDSNRYTLRALLRHFPVQIIDMGVIPDQPEAIRQAFTHAAQISDLVITSGGVSVGDADYVKTLLDEMGDVGFWRIAMKPGKPLAFGRLNSAHFFGLPGNPVSVMATFSLFVRPALEKLCGQQPQKLLHLPAKTTHALKKRPGRTDFQRGIFSQADNGEILVATSGLQSSHVLSGMSQANCLIRLEKDQADVAANELVNIIPLANLL